MLFPDPVLGIDQSMNGTGICVLKAGKPVLLETLSFEAEDGYKRLTSIRDRLTEILYQWSPTLIQMEGLSMGSNMNSVVTGAELGGVIKELLSAKGYGFGKQAVKGDKACLVVSPMTMKKFCLGHGNIQKDERYLLTVLEILKINFVDSNQADAYMHAWMGGIVAQVVAGAVPLSNLPVVQQEALVNERTAKRILKMGKTKAMKQPDELRVQCIDDFNP